MLGGARVKKLGKEAGGRQTGLMLADATAHAKMEIERE